MKEQKQKENIQTGVRSEERVLFMRKERFAKSVYPIIAGVPTAIAILFFLDLGSTYQDLLRNLISPIITGVTSGFILHFIGIKG